MVNRRSVRRSPEFDRIKALPYRVPIADLVRQMTEVLRTPDGTMSLRPVQAQALHDIGTQRGAFLPVRVGGGKTLVSLLTPYILEARRPVLLLPAALVEKTERERHELAKHWRVAKHMPIMSYEMLGRVGASTYLEGLRPDLIVADEVHRLKNKRAGVTRRVKRWMHEHPETMFVGMSGSILTHSLHDFAHILEWCLGEGAPIPCHEGTLQEWADSLDPGIPALARVRPGVLLDFGGEGDTDTERARRGYQRRLTETPGVVASLAGDSVACSLYVRGHEYTVDPVTEANFQRLRSMWETPDGHPICEAIILWRHARELAAGLHYIWDPRPPEPWMQARKTWFKFVRDVLKDSRSLDTPHQVELTFPDDPLLLAWKEIQPTFIPNSVPVWHDDSVLKWCAKWLASGADGLCWVEHRFFAEELSKRTGIPYFGAQGLDANGRALETHHGPAIVGIAANSTGRNLQRWSRNLIVSPMCGHKAWEQLLGRTHRDGQEADEVSCDVLLGCAEHLQGFQRALEGARAAKDILGADQKLLLADITMPRIVHPTVARWIKSTDAVEGDEDDEEDQEP